MLPDAQSNLLLGIFLYATINRFYEILICIFRRYSEVFRNHIACIMKDDPKVMELADNLETKKKEVEKIEKVADNIAAKNITEQLTASEMADNEIGKNNELDGYPGYDANLVLFETF